MSVTLTQWEQYGPAAIPVEILAFQLSNGQGHYWEVHRKVKDHPMGHYKTITGTGQNKGFFTWEVIPA